MSKICLDCIGDPPLNERLQPQSRRVRCNYCRSSNDGVSLEELAENVEQELREFYSHGEYVPYSSPDSDNAVYEQEGDSLEGVLQDELAIEWEPAQALAKLLCERDPADERDGEVPFFESDQNYTREERSAFEYDQKWMMFSERIKHGRRFFDPMSQATLEDMLGKPGSTKAERLPVLDIGPGYSVTSIYRARVATTNEEALKFTKDPVTELGPPPPHKATAGRMNSAGIPAFYGALSANTAIAEVRPSVGSFVIVGRFTPLRHMRLLDLSRIGAGFAGSIFTPDYGDRAVRLRFLRRFHSLMASPIQPHDAWIDYLPTQAVAEYVTNILGFDGLLYGSAQIGEVPGLDIDTRDDPPPHSLEELANHNVVLLGNAGTVGVWDTPQGTVRCLGYETDSAIAKRITAINYEHTLTFPYDPDEKTPF